ncbi:MAG TPA: hypothetical protein VF485_10485 [Sphingomonas sp.]
MSKTTKAAGTSPFAHLLAGAAALARGGRLGSRAEQDETTDPDAEDPENDPDAEDPENDPDAEAPENDPDAEDPENDPDAEDPENDPDAEEPADEKEAKAFRAGHAAANKRACAIFGSKAATGRPDLAAYFAFQTNLTSSAAIAAMTVSGNAPGAPRRVSLDQRMGARRDARPGADSAAGGKGGSLAAKMIAVGERLGQVTKP